MQVEVKCKMCFKPVQVEMDWEYAKLNDPHGLKKLVCCNRCFDYRVSRQRVIDRLRRISIWMQLRKLSPEEHSELRKTSEELLHRFVTLVSRYRNVAPNWDEEALEAFINKPQLLGSHLKHLALMQKPEAKLL